MEIKCPKCEHSFEIEDATKRYRLSLLFIFLGIVILAYQNAVSNPSLIITILGGLSATAGLIWLVVVRFRSGRN